MWPFFSSRSHRPLRKAVVHASARIGCSRSHRLLKDFFLAATVSQAPGRERVEAGRKASARANVQAVAVALYVAALPNQCDAILLQASGAKTGRHMLSECCLFVCRWQQGWRGLP